MSGGKHCCCASQPNKYDLYNNLGLTFMVYNQIRCCECVIIGEYNGEERFAYLF